MSELQNAVKEIVDSFKDDRKKLADIPKNTMEAAEKLGEFFAHSNVFPEFDDPQKFRSALTEVAKFAGDGAYVALDVENKRLGIQKRYTTIQKQKSTEGVNPSFIGTPAVVQQPGGLFGWLGQRTVAKSQKDVQKLWADLQERAGRSDITTEQRVSDILAFGRDLIPEFVNFTLNNFHKVLCLLRLYTDEETKWWWHQDLGVHMNKLIAIVSAFSVTVMRYRESELNDVKLETFRGITQVVAATALSGGMSTAEMMRALRTGLGPEDAGR